MEYHYTLKELTLSNPVFSFPTKIMFSFFLPIFTVTCNSSMLIRSVFWYNFRKLVIPPVVRQTIVLQFVCLFHRSTNIIAFIISVYKFYYIRKLFSWRCDTLKSIYLQKVCNARGQLYERNRNLLSRHIDILAVV